MTTYKDAGVDISVAEQAKDKIKGLVKGTLTKDSVVKPGFFCGGIRLNTSGFKDPILMLSADGVGTKLMIARMMDRYDTVGTDLVHHCVNDILTSGAKPVFFLDYVASERIEPKVSVEVVKGVADACKKLGIVLAGGETAQMPGVYVKGELDLAGVIGGMVDHGEIIDGSSIVEGDVLVGVASSGLHTNGYSLARKVLFDEAGLKVSTMVSELKKTLGDVLLEPHREYLSVYLSLKKIFKIKGIAHITGGGMTDNIPRVIPAGLGVTISVGSWKVPYIFNLIMEKGNVPDADMRRTFNMGVGIVFVVGKKDAAAVFAELRKMGEDAWIIGEVVKGEGVSYVEG